MTKIRSIPSITSAIPPAVSKVLEPMKQAIEQIGEGMVTKDQFRGDVLKVVLGSGVTDRGGGSGTNAEVDRKIAELQDLIRQAQQDAAELVNPIRMSTDQAFQALGQAQANLSDINGLSDELADQADELADQALELLDLATDVDLLQVSVGDLESDFLATSTLLDATVLRVDVTEDSIDVISAAITSLQAELIDTTAFDPGIIWQFEGSLDGWTSNFTLTANDFFFSVPDDSGTYSRSPSGIAIDGRLYTRIIARIRRTAGTGWLGRASYATSGGSAHGIDTTNFHLTLVTEPTFAGGGWVIVVWDMEMLTAGGTDWVDNIIDQIQLELSDDAATEFDVDWVAIGRVAPSFFSGSLAALTSRVTATEDAITALSSDVVSLESRATDLEGDVDAVTTAVDTLSTRVTATEDSIDAQSADIISLETRVDDAEDDISATSTALGALTTRVTLTEDSIEAQAADITDLEVRVTSAEDDIEAGATATSALEARVTSAEGVNTSQGSAITSLQNTVNHPTTGVTATATGLSNLTTRVTSAENTLSSQAGLITALESEIDDPETGLVANSQAIDSLQTSVIQIGDSVALSAQQVNRISVSLRDGETLVNPLITAAANQDWDVPALGVLPASDIFVVNLGGRVRGAARIRSTANLQRISRGIEIDHSAVYEVRFSLIKTSQNGRIYAGMYTSLDGLDVNTTAVTPVINRVAAGGPTSNPYFFFAGGAGAHANFQANKWYDVVCYIAGADAPLSRIPPITINGFRPTSESVPTLNMASIAVVDGFRLPSSARFMHLRAVNGENTVQTDMHFNQVTIRKLHGLEAGIEEERSARIAADGVLSAQWVIQLNVNGRISGIKLADNSQTSSFAVVADRFSVSLPSNAGVTVTPFVVGLVNGTPTVGITGNLIVDGTIFTRNLQAGGVTTEKMAPQCVNKTVMVNGGFQNLPPGTYDIHGLTIVPSDPGALVRVDWAVTISHEVNSDPIGDVIPQLIQDDIFGQTIVSSGNVSSRNFLGIVYPGFTTTEFVPSAPYVGTFLSFSVRLNIARAGYTLRKSFLSVTEVVR